MITERTIINALIVVGVLVVMPFIISSAFEENNFIPAAAIVALISLMAAFFIFKDRLGFAPLLGLAILGNLNFIPLRMSASNIFSILLILYYITGYFVIRQTRIRTGLQRLLWPILILTAILLDHNHSLGLHSAGSAQSEGNRPAFLVYLSVIAYFCGINLRTPSVNFVSKVPWYYFSVALVGAIPFALSSLIPALAPVLSTFTSQVNVGAYQESQSNAVGADFTAARNPVFGAVAIPLQVCLLSYYPMGTWIRPERWWVLVLSAGCAFCVAITGYRSILFVYGLIFLAAAWCYYSWRSLIIPLAAFFGMVLLVSASANNVIPIPTDKLPRTVQRALSFLPAQWDPQVLASAESSNNFRKNIINIYEKEYFWKSPLLGNGYNIDTRTFDGLRQDLLAGGLSGMDMNYKEGKLYIEGKMFHTGWLSLYDAVGGIGFLAFLALSIVEIWIVGTWVLEPGADRRSSLYPCYVWLFCNLISTTVSFFTVFGDFSQGLQNLLVYGIVLSQITDLREIADVPATRREPDGSVDFARSGGSRYGYGYQSRY